MKKRRALSLIEVVIATGLIVIIGTISLILTGVGLSSLKRAKALHNATSLAQQKMEEGIATAPKKLGTLSGTFPSPYQDYTYSVRYEPNSKYEALQNMFLNVNGPFATNIAYAATLPAPSTKIGGAVICDLVVPGVCNVASDMVHVNAVANNNNILVRVKGYDGNTGKLRNYTFTVAKTSVKGLIVTANPEVYNSSGVTIYPNQVHLSFRDIDGTQEQLCSIDLQFRAFNVAGTTEVRIWYPSQGAGWTQLSWSHYPSTTDLTSNYSDYCQTITP